MTTSPQLDALQRWMMNVISHPLGLSAGIESPAARQEIPIAAYQLPQVISPSLHNSSEQRLGVYSDAYFARLLECMAAEFPAVRHVVGEESFTGFVLTFLQQFPPASYTLGELGRRFPESLRLTRPEKAAGTGPDWADFLIELATLERIYSEVFDGPGEEQLPVLSAEALRLIPTDRWPDIRLETSRSLQLVRFSFPVHEYVTSVRKEEPVAVPAPRETCLVIHRRDFIVRRTAVDPLQFQLLKELQRGLSLSDAMQAVIQSGENQQLFSPSHLQHWFRDWTAAGYFTGVHLAPVPSSKTS